MIIRREIKNLIERAIKDLQNQKDLPGNLNVPKINIGSADNRASWLLFGDYSSAIATKIAAQIRKPAETVDIANKIKKKIESYNQGLFQNIKISDKPVFLNFFLSEEYLLGQVEEILKKGERYKEEDLKQIGNGRKINVEFISANPTGPLHIGNARGGFCGDVLANVLAKAGYNPSREYYINDRGRQIKFLHDTLLGDVVYKNEYTGESIKKGEKNIEKAVGDYVDKIKKTTERMGIKFDKWFFESELYPKEAKQVLDFLKGKKLISEEEDGSVWFKSKQFGDDKDRVLVRAKEKTTYEEETYFLSDIAYLKNKFKRNFDYLIIFLGAEHHGYIPRLKAAVEALGYNKDQLVPIVFQLVKLIEGGKEVKMSKRTGVFITIDELLNDVPLDVARFFFLAQGYDTHLNFDLDLAKEQSEKNPVYYVQYAHARICSILAKAASRKLHTIKKYEDSAERFLIGQLIKSSDIIEDAAEGYQVQQLSRYATNLATSFHQFYRDCQVISDDKNLTQARLALISATKLVLKNILDLMGISAPEKM